jgi:hypothetical protein
MPSFLASFDDGPEISRVRIFRSIALTANFNVEQIEKLKSIGYLGGGS